MPTDFDEIRRQFERGVVILSFDVEQIWGYLDLLGEAQFQRRYPGAFDAHTKLLDRLSQANISTTWFLVGGMALRGSHGDRDCRMSGLPFKWTSRIREGDETTAPLWYRRCFVERLRNTWPAQEIGLHGGLTHFIWTDPMATPDAIESELAEGVRALEEAGITPRSFSFAREQETDRQLLMAHGFLCYRGRTVAPSFRLRPALLGKIARLTDEIRRSTPHVVWPQETLPGLWNIPSSLFLYPIQPLRTRFADLRSRVERFRRGVEAAARHRGIFHYCLHPENLTEAPEGFAIFEEMLEYLNWSRDRGDIEVLTVGEMAARMERARKVKPFPHLHPAPRILTRVK